MNNIRTEVISGYTESLKDQTILLPFESFNIIRQIVVGKSLGLDFEPYESMFYTGDKQERPDYTKCHTREPKELSCIEGVRAEVGNFIQNDSVDHVIERGILEERGHIKDKRGDLTLIKQGNIDRIDLLFPDRDLSHLPDFFDLKRSPITTSYVSRTLAGQARDVDYRIGEAGIHSHPCQTDRFVLTDGCWEIVLLDLRKDSSTYLELVCLSFDASQDNQLAFTIPPGVAHTVGCFRTNPTTGNDNEYATLVNFPTLCYGELPSNIKEMLQKRAKIDPQELAKIAKRFVEGRLDPNRLSIIFLWPEYVNYLAGNANGYSVANPFV